MLDKSEIKKELLSKIAHNKLKEVFDYLIQNLFSDNIPSDPDILNKTVALSFKYTSQEEDFLNGLVSWETIQIDRMKLATSLVTIVNKIPKTKLEKRIEEKDEKRMLPISQNSLITYDAFIDLAKGIQNQGNQMLSTINKIRGKQEQLNSLPEQKEEIQKLLDEINKLKIKLKKQKEKYQELNTKYRKVKKTYKDERKIYRAERLLEYNELRPNQYNDKKIAELEAIISRKNKEIQQLKLEINRIKIEENKSST